jgi:hypothetical protein
LIVDLDIRLLILLEIFMSRAWWIACESDLYQFLSLGNKGTTSLSIWVFSSRMIGSARMVLRHLSPSQSASDPI